MPRYRMHGGRHNRRHGVPLVETGDKARALQRFPTPHAFRALQWRWLLSVLPLPFVVESAVGRRARPSRAVRGTADIGGPRAAPLLQFRLAAGLGSDLIVVALPPGPRDPQLVPVWRSGSNALYAVRSIQRT